jgi:hypothetical protein
MTADLLYSDVVEVSAAQSEQRLLEMLDDSEFIATSWQEGALVATLVKMTAETESRLSKITLFLKKAFQSSTARGEALTRTASGFYNNIREDAIASQHLVTLECSATEGPHTINLGDVVLIHPDGHTFRNIDGNSISYPLNLASGTDETLLFEAEVAGSRSNIGTALTPAAVTLSLESTLAGVSITEHSMTLAGVDEESDVRLNERNVTKWADQAELELIDDRVKQICLKASPSIIHVIGDYTNPRGAGTFDVYLAGLDTTADDDDVVKAQVAIDRRSIGRTASPKECIVKKSPTVDVILAGTVYYSGSFEAADIRAEYEEALLAFIRATPSGGFDFSPGPRGIIRLNDLESVIRLAVTDFTGRPATVEFTSPTDDIPVPSFGRPVLNSTAALVPQATSSNQ